MTLLNTCFFKDFIIKDEPFHRSHGAKDDFLGGGIIYYGLTYALQAKVAVCLGSGGGFVPRLMRQAQRDVGIDGESRTILIDANLPETGWGEPNYHNESNFFKENFDVEIIRETTKNALPRLKDLKIDYLHIDADHSYEWAKHDLVNYSKLVTERAVITMHDAVVRQTKDGRDVGVWRVVQEAKDSGMFDAVTLPFALGIAVLRFLK